MPLSRRTLFATLAALVPASSAQSMRYKSDIEFMMNNMKAIGTEIPPELTEPLIAYIDAKKQLEDACNEGVNENTFDYIKVTIPEEIEIHSHAYAEEKAKGRKNAAAYRDMLLEEQIVYLDVMARVNILQEKYALESLPWRPEYVDDLLVERRKPGGYRAFEDETERLKDEVEQMKSKRPGRQHQRLQRNGTASPEAPGTYIIGASGKPLGEPRGPQKS